MYSATNDVRNKETDHYSLKRILEGMCSLRTARMLACGCWQLKLHIQAHLNLREFQCDQCDCRFNDKTNLAKHILRVHVAGQFSCLPPGGRRQRHAGRSVGRTALRTEIETAYIIFLAGFTGTAVWCSVLKTSGVLTL